MSSSDWRIQPLRNFWQSVNWENRAITTQFIDSGNNGSAAPVLSLLMSVREYFRAISWTGVPAIAATAIENQPNINSIVDENKETLEDFLDDISKFF